MKRSYLLPFAFALVLVTSGCFGLFGGISEEQECAGAAYDFSTDANATYTIDTNGTYRAVYKISNSSTIELYRSDGLGNNRPLQISAVQFRANNTTYDCEAIDVETSRRKTTITLPEENGTFAYTTGSSPKRFITHKFVEGTHEVILPEDRSISNPLFGSVQPGGFNSTTVDGRVHLRWEEVRTNSLSVQYYMNRDIPLFFGVVGVGGLLAIGGLAYYYRLIQGLREKRREAGLDFEDEEDEDEFGRDPPPGF